MTTEPATPRERAEALAHQRWPDLPGIGPADFNAMILRREALVAGFLARDAEVAAQIRTARSMEPEAAAESYRRGDRHPWAMSVRAYLKRRALQVRGEK
ncbi:hypothetical protein [Nesterenkonia sandarakina]|uniref:Uncharacterized protein n=1 Tax=Nesterenkonia sandarakina TaxID=272918 RepID=A0A2T0YIY1_9MICC|nr:hypothetical protein [Nesterenkonia sandarakina]PRZ15164.1 hypothetical protein BCL67_10985 [Nesterenkonia sandarakina]